MIKRSDASVKRFLTKYGIEDDVYRLAVVYEDIYENEPQWMTDRNYLREAITLYVLRIYSKSLNRWGVEGEDIFRCLTGIPDVMLHPTSQRDAWEKFRTLHGYAVPKTLKGDVDLTRVPTSMHWHIDNEYLGRVCDALLENVKKAAELFN